MTTHQAALISRLRDEADLCRNDGADDIARLLDEAAAALQPAQQAQAAPDRTGLVYYKNSHCKAASADAPDCICWTPEQKAQAVPVDTRDLFDLVRTAFMNGRLMGEGIDEREAREDAHNYAKNCTLLKAMLASPPQAQPEQPAPDSHELSLKYAEGYQRGHDAGWASAIEHVKAQQPAAAVPDERKAFEAWAVPVVELLDAPFSRDVYPDGEYDHPKVLAMWKAWQARAMLAASPSAQEQQL